MRTLSVAVLVSVGLMTGTVRAVILDVGLDPAQEVPAPSVNGSDPAGTAAVSVNTITGDVSVNGSYSGMTSPVAAAHIHGLAAPGTTAGVLIPLTPTDGTSGSLDGTGTLSAEELTGLLDGLTYINVHTANNSPGEIRGQIADSNIRVFNIYLSPRQAVATPTHNGSSPSGRARVVMDTASGRIEISGTFTGMTGDVLAAHLHGFATIGGMAGIRFPLSFDNTIGRFSGSSTGLEIVNESLAGNTYINLHTEANGAGEIRGSSPNP